MCALATKVRDIIKEVEADGWVLVRVRGSHRIFQHPNKPGNVVIPGNPGDDVPVGTLHSIRKQAGIK